jgi:hypothetical protein
VTLLRTSDTFAKEGTNPTITVNSKSSELEKRGTRLKLTAQQTGEAAV